MKSSIVIPYFNDLEPLNRLLKRLSFYAQYIDQIVVVDASKDPNCHMLCEAHQVTYIQSDQACRGYQLNMGAEQIKSGTLFFMHADARPSKQHFSAITSLDLSQGYYFQFQFSGKSKSIKRIFEQLIKWRNKIGTPYGDQGLVIDKNLFTQAGGFANSPLFEEVPLIKYLRKHSQLKALPIRFLVDDRKYKQQGYWRRGLKNRWLATLYALGVSTETLAQKYLKQSLKNV